MNKILAAFRDTLKVIRDIAITLLQLVRVIRRYPLFFSSVGLLAGLVAAGIYMSYWHPAQIIRNYFSSIQSKQPARAWDLLDPNYKKVWQSDFAQFEQGYSTTTYYRNISIQPKNTAWNPLGFLFDSEVTYVVTFQVEDRFTKDDFQIPIHRRGNLLWLQIAHPADTKKLLDGTLGHESLSLQRYYEQQITVSRVDWRKWLIVLMQTKSLGIKR